MYQYTFFYVKDITMWQISGGDFASSQALPVKLYYCAV